MPVPSLQSILVTGGAGFIGSHFVGLLLEEEPQARLVVLDALTYAGRRENLEGLLGDRHTFVQGDICDTPLVSALMREHQVDTVVHFAAESHVDRSITSAAPFLHTNVLGTASLLEAARTAWLGEGATGAARVRFHQVSTDEVYGDLPPGVAADEEAPYRPGNPYSASKAGADHLVRAWARTYGLPVSLSMGCNTFGPRQIPEKLIPLVVERALTGREIPLYGDGQQEREWISAADHCRGILQALRLPGGSWNVGSGVWRENRDLLEQICQILDELAPAPGGRPHAEKIRSVPDRPGHDRRYALDSRKLRATGWRPQIELEGGLRETLRWYIRVIRGE